MDKSEKFILCIEDDEDSRDLIAFVFRQAGCRIKTCSEQSWLTIMKEDHYAAVILDNHLSGLSGTEICQRIHILHPKTPIIFFSGESRQSEINKAMNAAAALYLIKPLDFEKLVPSVMKLIG
jgi:DNA-binding response OmpR family regulator